MTNKCPTAFCDVVHLETNKTSRNTIKILLAAKELNHSSQVLPLQGAIAGEFHMQRESMTL